MPIEDYHQVHDLIRASNKSMKYSWYRRRNDFRHTGIVISFDGAQTISLDFGAVVLHPKSMLKLAAIATANTSLKISEAISPTNTFDKKEQKFKKFVASTELKGKISLNQFSPENAEVMGTLLKLKLERKEEKQNAMNMFIYIAQIDIGEYQLMENNCRNYVITVAIYLKEYQDKDEGENWSNFENEMQQLLSDDHYKFDNLAKSALTYISAKSESISQAIEEKSLKVFSQKQKMPIAEMMGD